MDEGDEIEGIMEGFLDRSMESLETMRGENVGLGVVELVFLVVKVLESFFWLFLFFSWNKDYYLLLEWNVGGGVGYLRRLGKV